VTITHCIRPIINYRDEWSRETIESTTSKYIIDRLESTAPPFESVYAVLAIGG